jgi:drug/metabolite transporter (DMT)-like permease
VHRRQLFDYVALAVIWGASFIVLLKVVGAFGPMGAVSLRSLAAAGVLVLAAGLTRRRLDFGHAWRPIAVVGATTVAGQLVGLSFATPRIGTSMAAILVATIPLFSAVIGRLWRIEEVSATGRVGLGLGFGGIVLLVGFPSVEVTPAFVLGCASSLFGSVCAAFGSNWARRHLRAVGSWEQTTGAFLVGGLLTLPLMLLTPAPAMPTLGDVACLLVLAAVCSALAYVLYFRLVAEVGATLAISVEFVVPVLAVVIGAVALGERLTAPQVVGGAVIILGCAMVVGLVPRSSRVSASAAAPRDGG